VLLLWGAAAVRCCCWQVPLL